MCDIAGSLVFSLFRFEVDEKEQFVFDDRSAKREPGLKVIEGRYDELVARDLFSGEGVVAIESEDGAIERVGSGFSDRIYAGPGKARLCHVIGSEIHLYLIDGIQRYRLRIGLAAGSGGVQAEGVIKDGAIEGEVIVLSIPSGEGHPVVSG